MTDATIVALLPSDTQALWFLNRATGLVLLGLLTLSLVLGVVASSRRLPSWWPRFIGNELHRRVSVFSLVFLGLHILTAVLDSFVDLDLFDVVIPALTPYRPFWMALGTLATDVLIAVLITTALRARMSERSWRLSHALTYLMWPMALLHGLGIGTDTRNPAVLAFNAICVGLVVASVVWRLSTIGSLARATRLGAIGMTLILVTGIAAWLTAGPLAPDWSRTAGTPPPPSTAGSS